MHPYARRLFCFGLVAFATCAHAQWFKSPEIKQLYQDAKNEKEVVLWGTAAREVDWVPAAFNAMFPGIEVKASGDTDITTRAIAEARAGRSTVDVMVTSLSLVLRLDERKMLSSEGWADFGVDKSHVALDGRMAYTHNIAYTIAYNKNKVAAKDVPKHWADLLDPKYKGKMVGQQFLFPRMVAVLAIPWGEEKATQFARDLHAKADIMITRAPREAMLQSGERLYALSEVDSFPKLWARDGLPIGWVIPDPVITAQFGVVVMDTAPHKAAARLLAGWLASPEGKRAREKLAFQTDYLPTSENPEAKKIYASGAKVVLDTPEDAARRVQLIEKIAPIVSGQSR